MTKNPEVAQDWKDWYGEQAKQAASEDDGLCRIVGMVSAIVDSDADWTDARRIAHIRCLLEAYDREFSAIISVSGA